MRHVVAAVGCAAVLFVGLVVGSTPAVAIYGGIKLPYPNGVTYQVTQIPGSCGSHCAQPDYWAYDFGIPDGNLVSAVKHGTIIRSYFGSNLGGCSSSYANYANYVVLDHRDGYSSIYWHLKYNTQQVPLNTAVYQGRPLGGSDNTGWSCNAHLHFAVQTTPAAGQTITNSVQITFDEAGQPAQWSYQTSQNRKQFSAQFISQSPWVSLAAGQVTELVGRWRNVGWDQWKFNESGRSARLGTWNPIPGQDQPSVLGGAPGCSVVTDWYLCNRIRPTTDQVDPDQDGWFAFDIRGPTAPGTYYLYVRPLVEGVTWMEDYGVYWQVTRP